MKNTRFKFRVWFNKLIRYSKNTDDLMLAEDGTLGAFDTVGCYSKDDVVIEQCTGLKDNNGKLIYDGDFLDYKGEVCLVFWSEPTACFGVMLQDSGYTDYAGDIKRSDLYSIDAEIIGNIHENPELLKEEQ